jgi:hypothetical protein
MVPWKLGGEFMSGILKAQLAGVRPSQLQPAPRAVPRGSWNDTDNL